MNIHSILYVPGDPLCLPVNYDETFWAYWVSCRMAMVVYRERGPEVFLEPVLKDLPDSPIYSSGQLMCGHLYLYVIPLF